MLELKTKQKLAQEAHRLAKSFNLVRFRDTTYIPVDYETLKGEPPPDPERTVWLPLKREDKRIMAADQFETLFATDSELKSFDFMVAQNSTPVRTVPEALLIRTEQGLKRLEDGGVLEDPTGDFMPNYIKPMLNVTDEDKKMVLDTIVEWVDGETEAESLLRHLATSLAPGWSAIKYILLLGEGRNGKSVLLKMLAALFGEENISHVTRQNIADQSPVVVDLNGKLLNLIYDGQAEYLKDSGGEKTLIAGEPFPIRLLYESNPTIVQTNALFIEALQREPKSSDKSPALQKRLVRFHFPNVYPNSRAFEKKMLSEKTLGAFLAVLIDHYVKEDDVATMLVPTGKAQELAMEHMYSNSIALQYLKWVEHTDEFGVEALIGITLEDLVSRFKDWRRKENDQGSWSEPDVIALFGPVVTTDRVSKRIDGKPRKVRVVGGLRPEAKSFIETMKEEEDAELLEAVVDN